MRVDFKWDACGVGLHGLSADAPGSLRMCPSKMDSCHLIDTSQGMYVLLQQINSNNAHGWAGVDATLHRVHFAICSPATFLHSDLSIASPDCAWYVG